MGVGTVYALQKHREHDSKGLHQQVSSAQISHSHAALSCATMASFCHWSHTALNCARAFGSASKTSSQLIISLITENSLTDFRIKSTKKVIKLSLVPRVETTVIFVGAETGTREGVTVGETIFALPRLICGVIDRPHHLARTVGMMLDGVRAHLIGQPNGRVQCRVIGIAHALCETPHDTLSINN